MKLGEKSCRHYDKCPIPDDQRDVITCTALCKKYEWDELTTPDKLSLAIRKLSKMKIKTKKSVVRTKNQKKKYKRAI